MLGLAETGMTKEETDLEFHKRLLARSRASKVEELERAKRDAEERGKQTFDLTILEQHYDTSIDGWLPERADREADYEYRYYVTYPAAMSLAEYAVAQFANDAGGSPPERTDPAMLAARAETLLARTPASLENRLPLRIEQARLDIQEAIAHLESIVRLIPAGAERVPDEAFMTYTTKRWSEKHPERFNRTELRAAIENERSRLARLT